MIEALGGGFKGILTVPKVTEPLFARVILETTFVVWPARKRLYNPPVVAALNLPATVKVNPAEFVVIASRLI